MAGQGHALISVITPSYNQARFVAESIASAAAQTYPRVELIVVDDGSDDDSLDVIARSIDEHGSRFERCVVRRQRHRGPSATLNRALRLAQGEFVSVLDSDDRFLPDKLAVLAASDGWASADTAVVFGNASFIDDRGNAVNVDHRPAADPSRSTGFATELELHLAAVGRPVRWEELGTYASLIEASYIPDGATLIRRRALQAVGNFDRGFLTADFGLWLKLSRASRMVPVDAVVAEKRWHTQSMTVGQRSRMVRDYATLLVRERRHCNEPELLAIWRAGFARAVNTVLTISGRASLAWLLRAGNPLTTADELRRVAANARRVRRTHLRPLDVARWDADVGLPGEYRQFALDFLGAADPPAGIRVRRRIEHGVRDGRLGRFIAAAAAVPGWVQPHEAVALARASRRLPRRAVVVEIGAFLGRSTVLLAGGRRVSGSGTVHTVDTFEAEGDAFSVPYYVAVARLLNCSLREYFDDVLRRSGLAERVVVHEAPSAEVAATWTQPIDMLFFDADQTPEGTRAAYLAWTPHLTRGGLLALHSTLAREEGHDGPRRLAASEIHPPAWVDVHRVETTVFARKA